MKATGIVRRIDDLGRVVIPKEIRRTMRIREGDPLEIYTSRDGEVIFKKYSLMGGVEDFAAQLCETMSRSTGAICAVTDRDTVIAVAGGAKRELLGKRISAQLEQIMENRRIYQYDGQNQPVPVSDSSDRLMTVVAAPILSEGDLLGLVLFIGDGQSASGDAEYKLPRFWAATWKADACTERSNLKGNDKSRSPYRAAALIVSEYCGDLFFTVDLFCHTEHGPCPGPAAVKGGVGDDLRHFLLGDAVFLGAYQVIAEGLVRQPLRHQCHNSDKRTVPEGELLLPAPYLTEQNIVIQLGEFRGERA